MAQNTEETRDRFPQDPGQLSRAALDDAVDHVDRALKDAGEETRRAIGTIRLVTGFAREVPWAGKQVPSIYGEETVEAATVYRNMAETLEGHVHVLSDPIYKRGAERMARHLRYLVKRGRREYGEYLDQLFPRAERAQQEQEPQR